MKYQDMHSIRDYWTIGSPVSASTVITIVLPPHRRVIDASARFVEPAGGVELQPVVSADRQIGERDPAIGTGRALPKTDAVRVVGDRVGDRGHRVRGAGEVITAFVAVERDQARVGAVTDRRELSIFQVRHKTLRRHTNARAVVAAAGQRQDADNRQQDHYDQDLHKAKAA